MALFHLGIILVSSLLFVRLLQRVTLFTDPEHMSYTYSVTEYHNKVSVNISHIIKDESQKRAKGTK